MLADPEAIVRRFLDERLNVSVHTRVPNPRPAAFVRAWRTGGFAVNRVLDRPLITVQAWAGDSETAVNLANQCRDLMLNGYTAMTLVRGIEETSAVYYDPDPATGTDRYTFTHQLSVRATF